VGLSLPIWVDNHTFWCGLFFIECILFFTNSQHKSYFFKTLIIQAYILPYFFTAPVFTQFLNTVQRYLLNPTTVISSTWAWPSIQRLSASFSRVCCCSMGSEAMEASSCFRFFDIYFRPVSPPVWSAKPSE